MTGLATISLACAACITGAFCAAGSFSSIRARQERKKLRAAALGTSHAEEAGKSGAISKKWALEYAESLTKRLITHSTTPLSIAVRKGSASST